MAERRSGRTKKSVDYAKFGSGIENDDDFQDSPPSKRLKSDLPPLKTLKVKVIKCSNVLPRSDDANEKKNLSDRNLNCSPKPRLSVDDKVLQRQINMALEVSKKDFNPLFEKEENLRKESEKEKLVTCKKEINPESDIEKESSNYSSDESSEKEENMTKESETGKFVTSKKEVNLKSEIEKDSSDYSNDESSEKEENLTKENKAEKRIARRNRVNFDNDTDKKSSDCSDGEWSEKAVSDKCENKNVSIKQNAVRFTKANSKKVTDVSPSNSISLQAKSSKLNCDVSSISRSLMLPAKELRLGLSRKIVGKPLHTGVRKPS